MLLLDCYHTCQDKVSYGNGKQKLNNVPLPDLFEVKVLTLHRDEAKLWNEANKHGGHVRSIRRNRFHNQPHHSKTK